MKENVYQTACGPIHYWRKVSDLNAPTLAFLPGLTADHRLFDKQIAFFEGKFNLFTWDAPGHASSWPFRLDFDLFDKARWLEEIFTLEKRYASGADVSKEMESLAATLSLEEMIAVDEYILENLKNL